MQETGTFLHLAALATLVAIPLVAVCAVLLGIPCDGCGELYAPGELEEGPLETRWCAACLAADAAAPPAYDRVQEDDGEP